MAAIKQIDEGKMSGWQVLIVVLTIALNALDGFDVLSISFAAPGIALEWGIDPAALGVVLSAELFGMAIGSVLIGNLADRIGRRPTILGCLVAMTFGMFMVSQVDTIAMLGVWRVVTGLGIGGMLAAINATTAEFSNRRWRPVAMALMVIGYPLGAVVGGLAVQSILADGSWRDIFVFGAAVTAAFIPLCYFFIPESPSFLAAAKGSGALQGINRLLAKYRLEKASQLPSENEGQPRRAAKELFGARFGRLTLFLTIAYFAHIVAFYFILKWAPKIVVDMGYEPSSAAGVLVWANVGGALGGAVFGLVAAKAGLLRSTVGALLLSFAAVSYFGAGETNLDQLAIIVFVAGFCTNSAIVGLYTILAAAYPTDLRASGTGFVIGFGRGGSALAPIFAGLLFAGGLGLQAVAIAMAAGSLVAAAALLASGFNRHTKPEGELLPAE